jgi:hypothetical protein
VPGKNIKEVSFESSRLCGLCSQPEGNWLQVFIRLCFSSASNLANHKTVLRAQLEFTYEKVKLVISK